MGKLGDCLTTKSNFVSNYVEFPSVDGHMVVPSRRIDSWTAQFGVHEGKGVRVSVI
jgi:hypothetical protein